MFVNGPVGTIQIPSSNRHESMMKPTASSESAPAAGGDSAAPAPPDPAVSTAAPADAPPASADADAAALKAVYQSLKGRYQAAGFKLSYTAMIIKAVAMALEEHPALDLTIDGADEVDPQWDVTKGLGGCLLREKVVAYATRFEIIVVDESKLVAHLGQRSPIPVEVLQFGWQNTLRGLEKTGARPVLRRQGDTPFVTDEGNWILDCHYASIPDAGVLGRQIKEIPGVVEHGLFLGMVHQVIVAGANGVRVLERK